jgi:hypothetical protein
MGFRFGRHNPAAGTPGRTQAWVSVSRGLAVGVGSAGLLPSFDGAQDGVGSLKRFKSDGLLARTVPTLSTDALWTSRIDRLASLLIWS